MPGMFTFSSHAKCLAYEHKYFSRPRTWPPTTHAVPALWERAKSLLADTIRTVGSAMTLACRQVFTRKQRRELILRLEPVEKIVRRLLCIEAITFLLMTPAGLKMRQTTQQVMPALRTAKKPDADTPVHAAMMTIAANRPRIDPRIAEREAREAREAKERMAQSMDHLCAGLPVLNGAFPVLRWKHPPVALPPTHPLRRVWVDLLDERPGLPARAAEPDEDEEDLSGPMLAIARRIAALERVLANPGPAIRRLARRIASIPRDSLPEPQAYLYEYTRWWHGVPEYHNVTALVRPAFAALGRASALPPDDPG